MATNARADALRTVFEDWVASRPGRGPRAGNGALSDTSAQLYRDMWAVFTQFLLAHPMPRKSPAQAPDPTGLSRLRAADLTAFLESARQLTPSPEGWSQRYAWRMLHLIDRVVRFHSLRAGIGVRGQAHGVAAELLHASPLRYANASGLDQEPALLDAKEVRRLRRHVDLLSRRALREPGTQRWRDARDAAMVALMLGSGLAPGDVLALAVGGIDGPTVGDAGRRVRIPADGVSPEHEAPLAAWAVPAIDGWLQIRSRRGVEGTTAFPSTLRGTPMSRMSLHRRVVGLLVEAGIAGGVPFRLRHTFAVTQLAAGHDEAMVGRWMGLVESKAIERYVALARTPQPRR